MEQRTGSKLGKEYDKAIYCHPAYLPYMQSISWEMDEAQAGINIAPQNADVDPTTVDLTKASESPGATV